ncbi:uncharacterized protein LOC127240882 [Andrographis paniculata]|uniref:uncharacterized protein LOC127240882 n=1 Tax=Andrographis paniculata TaxID=175694 RepID=UPI0021E7A392|nr:uncharacterized protein LOC127240882 [Andrographis paniculata]
MEMLMIRAQLVEDDGVAMYRFLNGLRRDIMVQMDMYPYNSTLELGQLATKIESQGKVGVSVSFGKASPNFNKYGGNTGPTKSWPKGDEKHTTKNEPLKVVKRDEQRKVSNDGSPNKAKDITFFKCQRKGHYVNAYPNVRTVVICDNGNYVHFSDDEVEDLEHEVEASEDETIQEMEEQVEENLSGESLVVLQMLGPVPQELEKFVDRLKEQWENLFHCRCKIGGKQASIIIDNGSFTNVVSWYMIDKLGLQTIKHLAPYHLEWINSSGDMKITRQAKVPISIGPYKEDVLCDVTPMTACHVLIGQPWQSDKGIIYDEKTNKVRFYYKGYKLRMLEEMKDVYPEELPQGLPPTRGIGWVRESLLPCVITVIIVAKKDETWRMCVDYRAVNAITIKYRHPIPRLDDLLDQINGEIIFSKIDLRSGYHQIRIQPRDEWKMAFKTKLVSEDGLKRFMLDFSLIAAPLTSLLKKGVSFKWEQADQEAFETLKAKLTHAPTLQHYLMPREFVRHTDHETLKHLRGKQQLNRRHAYWVSFIESFPYTIKYKKAKDNIVADTLSRKCSIWELLIQEVHGGDMIGHFGKNATMETHGEKFYRPGIRKQVADYISQCVTYLKPKSTLKPDGLYIPLPPP